MWHIKFPSRKVPYVAQLPVPVPPVVTAGKSWPDQHYLKADSGKHLCKLSDFSLLMPIVVRGTSG